MRGLPLLSLALLLIGCQSQVVTPVKAEPRPTAVRPALEPVVSGVAGQVILQINSERQKVGCPPLRANSRLMLAAHRQSSNMARLHVLSHESSGKLLAVRLDEVGYDYANAAENLAAGQMSVATVVRGWMNSPAHRANIVDCSLRETGVAIAEASDSYKFYWTQIFGTLL